MTAVRRDLRDVPADGVILGGVAYNLMVDARHASTIAAIATVLPMYNLSLTGAYYRHTSILPSGRYHWLESAIGTRDARWAVSIDSDTWIQGDAIWRLPALLRRLTSDAPKDLALVALAVPQRDNTINVWEAPGQRMQRPKSDPPSDPISKPYACGLAIAAYDLDVYRAISSESRAQAWGMVPSGEGNFVGEDMWHCAWLQKHDRSAYVVTSIPTIHRVGVA